MSNCLVCRAKTTRVAKEKAGRYTLCDSCVEKGYHIEKSGNVWFVWSTVDKSFLYSCNELLSKKEGDQ